MDAYPIEAIMNAALSNIRGMVDVNTVIGSAITTQDGSTVIPVSKVSFGFVSGGGEYSLPVQRSEQQPFAGGAGAGVTIQPMGFLVANAGQVRLLPTQHYAPLDRVIELIPQALSELKNIAQKKG